MRKSNKKHWRIVLACVGMMSVGLTTQCTSENKPQVEQSSIKHEVVKVTPYDAPVKTQLEYRVVLKQEASKDEVAQLLKQLYGEASARRGFKYHGGKATHIFIYVYPTVAHSGSQWAGMVSKVGKETKVGYQFNEAFFNEPKDGEEKAKLDVRKKIFKGLLLAEWKATEYSEKEFPKSFDKRVDRQRYYLAKFRKKIAEGYKLSEEDLSQIGMEGVTNKWAYPKRPQ